MRANEPAYPIVNEHGFPSKLQNCNDLGNANGLTKLEYFAGLAMLGRLSGRNPENGVIPELLAASSVAMARALLAELDKSTNSPEGGEK